MHQQLVDALRYPQTMFSAKISLQDDCVHAGCYDETDPTCRDCLRGFECRWLIWNDEGADLKRRESGHLKAALLFALGYIDALLLACAHDRHRCQCETCTWSRETHALCHRLRARGVGEPALSWRR